MSDLKNSYHIPKILFPLPSDEKGNNVLWQCLSPMEFVEKVAYLANGDIGVDDSLPKENSGRKPKIDTNFLADLTQPIPQPIQRIMNDNNLLTSSLLSSSKRKRDGNDANSSNSNKLVLPSSLLWDTNFIAQNDGTFEGNEVSLQLAQIAWQLQRDMQLSLIYTICFASYARLRVDFENEFHGIIEASKSGKLPPNEERIELDILYQDVLRKIDSVVKMVREITSNSLDDIMDIDSGNIPLHSEKKKVRNGTVNKKKLAEYMNDWLKANFTNPYPDDQTLNEIAGVLGAEPAIVGNWLINARTRRWRPAIVKAFSFERPSRMLLDDAISIFDGIPVKSILE